MRASLIERPHVALAGAGPLDPATRFDLFPRCLAQDGDTLRGLFPFSAAQNVNAVLLKADRPDSSRMVHAALLAETLQLDMGAWFTPTPVNYFSRISKAGIIEALREAKSSTAPAWSGMKKADLATLVEREIAGTGWLPNPLRVPTAAKVPEDGDWPRTQSVAAASIAGLPPHDRHSYTSRS